MNVPEPPDEVNTSQEDIELFAEQVPAHLQKKRSKVRVICERFIRNKAAIAGTVFLVFVFLFCFLGPLVTGHNHPDDLNIENALLDPSAQFPFGTDNVGRDQFARVMAGGRVSLLVGLSSMLTAIILGVGIGATAGYYGGIIDNIFMRITDVALAVPSYLLLFLLSASVANGSLLGIIALISVFGWTTSARLIRAEFLAIKEREYVLAARTLGAKDMHIMFRHILPNAAGPILVNATILIGNNIIFESILSYFGFGLHPPTASWGNIISDNQDLFVVAPLLVLIPGFFIFFTVLSFNLMGDGLRDALDPYMTER